MTAKLQHRAQIQQGSSVRRKRRRRQRLSQRLQRLYELDLLRGSWTRSVWPLNNVSWMKWRSSSKSLHKTAASVTLDPIKVHAAPLSPLSTSGPCVVRWQSWPTSWIWSWWGKWWQAVLLARDPHTVSRREGNPIPSFTTKGSRSARKPSYSSTPSDMVALKPSKRATSPEEWQPESTAIKGRVRSSDWAFRRFKMWCNTSWTMLVCMCVVRWGEWASMCVCVCVTERE